VRGKRREVRLVVAALACGGHVLIEDVPGTAKTALARAIAQSIKGATVGRIQCTPDLPEAQLDRFLMGRSSRRRRSDGCRARSGTSTSTS
jgi:MoxR-like ATPase